MKEKIINIVVPVVIVAVLILASAFDSIYNLIF